jgi:SAM-dependent methyltransferase
VQQFPRYSAAELSALYGGDYYVFAEDDAHRWARAVQQYVVHLLPLERRMRQRVLDVGCALGHFSALAAARGWRVCGVDVSAQAVSRAATVFGLDARAGTLAQYRASWPPFDVVFLGDVIEHVPDPRAFLADVRSVLAPGGAVCIDTPNHGGHWRRVGGTRWLGYNRFHINQFDATSLTRLLRGCGFRHVQAGGYTHYRYAAWSSRPELAPLLNRLPAALGWRARSLLQRLGRLGAWASLRDDPPPTQEAAARRVAEFARRPPAIARLRADNLIARAAL